MVILLNGYLCLSGISHDLELRNGHHKDPCHEEIGICAQAIGTILGSIVNTMGRAYVITETRK